ncbi:MULTISPECIES: acyl-CoA dehydrogenase family protein [Marinobacter]|uniref:Acyl-CoA dehydrogenase n=1 Tax=Marinobacter segnicrescens TaxID=430453 RepID=A0A1I0ICF8_9GAMM|nr:MULTISPECIES: acyl-CoA dehydrogenase family protein [Marinobacter]UZD65301.1 acyl-CoA dehydrogenase family protein [Marinobacter sp. AN1]SET94184.1 acyl-CoA dehydrogenase [Marinobacter segnicrescens]
MTTSSPFYTAEHEAFRDSVRAFVRKEIEPFVTEWDEAGTFPRELYKKAADIGLIPLGYPEEYGGIEADLFYMIIAAQELAMAGCGGLSASLMSHGIGSPPIVKYGSEALKQRVLPPIYAGEAISALAITEPGGGSDVAALKTTAKRDGDHYIVNGSKTFITSGMRADTYTVAVRTGEAGHKGISLLVIDRDTPGFTRTPLDRKMGWWCSDTATLYFDDCRVPAGNLLGEENQGSKMIMNNFNFERIFMAAGCIGFARACYEEVVDYARQRQTFGKSLIEHQVVRHKLADMYMKIEASQAYLEKLAWRIDHGDNPVADVCLLKNQSTLTMEYCAREAVQTLGGAGYLRGPKSERIYREVRVNAIGGGAEEIMRDLASRQLGL